MGGAENPKRVGLVPFKFSVELRQTICIATNIFLKYFIHFLRLLSAEPCNLPFRYFNVTKNPHNSLG